MVTDAAEDPVMQLLPGADAATRQRAESLSRALRLFASDAADSGSTSAAVQLRPARRALAGHRARHVEGLLEDLALHAARDCTTAESFLLLPAPERSYSGTWEVLLAALSRAERERIGLRVPGPGEDALGSLAMLVAAFAAHAERERDESPGAPGASLAALRAELWRTRVVSLSALGGGAATGGRRTSAVEGVERLDALLSSLEGSHDAAAGALRHAVLGDRLAMFLDAQALGVAAEELVRLGPMAGAPGECRTRLDALRWIAGWITGWPTRREHAAGRAGDREESQPFTRFPRLESWFERSGARAPAAWSETSAWLSSGHGPRARPRRRVGAPGARPVRDRRAVGATALVVSALGRGGELDLLHADVAPGNEPRLEHWLRARRFAAREPGAPEHDAARTASAARWVDALECSGAASMLGRVGLGEAPRALAVEPILDRDGEVLGTVWMEFSHRLLPSAAARAEVADSWTAAVVDRAPPRTAVTVAPVDVPWLELAGGREACRDEPASDDLQRTWGAVIDRLQLKTAERRWVAFHVVRRSEAGGPIDELVRVSEGGGGGERLGPPSDGGAWALRRALRTGGSVRYGLETGEPPRLAPGADGLPHSGEDTGGALPAGASGLHPGALSGAAIPMSRRGAVIAVVALESARRGDARARDVMRWHEVLQCAAPQIECAMIHGLDRSLFDGGFALSVEDPDVARDVERLGVLGASRADVTVLGPPGSGRRTAARWIHHSRGLQHGRSAGSRVDSGGGPLPSPSGGPSAGLRSLIAYGLTAAAIGRAFDAEGVSTLLISDAEWLDEAAQFELARRLEEPALRRPRVLVTLGDDPGAEGDAARQADAAARPSAARASALHPAFLRALGRVSFRTTPLRARRHLVPRLARFLLDRVAADEGAGEAALDDAALALLWRQDWPENVAGLEAALQSAYLRRDDDSLGLPTLVTALEDLGTEPRLRLPSRSPAPLDLASAAWVTRTATGRINKTRAALYLGWDPNTVGAHLAEAGLAGLDDVRRVVAGGD